MKSCHRRLYKRAAERPLAGMPIPSSRRAKEDEAAVFMGINVVVVVVTALVRIWSADMELFAEVRDCMGVDILLT